MNITYFIPPSIFPTSVKDPGIWLDYVSHVENNVDIFNCNYYFWKVLFGYELYEIINKEMLLSEIWNIELFEQTTENSIKALNKLHYPRTYESSEEYINCISDLTKHLKVINNVQKECRFTFMPGVKVNRLNYNKSNELLDYSNSTTLLSKIIDKALRLITKKIDILLVEITSQQDLLTSMISVNLLRKTNPNMYVCLVDHENENFSLKPFIGNLKTTNNLTKVFDSIIEYKSEKDIIIKALIDDISAGIFKKGFIKKSDFDWKNSLEKQNYILPLVPAHSSEPILWTRLSPNGCYWNRCVFCTHNTKHEKETNSNINFNEVFMRISQFIQAGYKNIVFSDEALPKDVLIDFCNGIIKERLNFKWLCRLRIEEGYTDELFELMKQAGCYEIIFGLESVSQNVLDLMNKYPKTLSPKTIGSVLNRVYKSGIAIHLNLIAGFPGETPQDLEDTINFVIKTFGSNKGVTFSLNKFSLFSNTTVINNPDKYNITPILEEGDIFYSHKFKYNLGEYVNEDVLNNLITKSYNKLMQGLGWTRFGFSEGANVALFLYFNSCHNAIFKSKAINVFNENQNIKLIT